MIQIDWDYIQQNWDWAGHILEAAGIAIVVALASRLFSSWRISFTIGLSFAAGHFHGREKRDYEVSVAMPPPHLDAYYFWNWTFDQATDFFPVAVICLVAIVLVLRIKSEGK